MASNCCNVSASLHDVKAIPIVVNLKRKRSNSDNKVSPKQLRSLTSLREDIERSFHSSRCRDPETDEDPIEDVVSTATEEPIEGDSSAAEPSEQSISPEVLIRTVAHDDPREP
ncbi:hypothetical protein NM688_g3704 [Phlebia brevispora]|uniref:Uncharacterized protein n=1 Tax=Phlebia brevispora TaxID=194682 RepID=A0ACC1T4S4_9APHY|nr:hypothetical protein NM688_g3704 [Phlebia brevispora]